MRRPRIGDVNEGGYSGCSGGEHQKGDADTISSRLVSWVVNVVVVDERAIFVTLRHSPGSLLYCNISFY